MKKLSDSRISSIKELTGLLLNYTDSFSFIIREEEKVSKNVDDLLEALKDYHIKSSEVSEWPGTQLLWDKANIHFFHLNNISAHLLYSMEDNLFNWLHPDLPEDFIFYKDNKPVFISITHEKDAYFDLENVDENFLWINNLID